jgi:outer membrane immunogenic protein
LKSSDWDKNKMKTKIVIAVVALLSLPVTAFAQAIVVVPGSASNSASASGWVAGGQAGYNWQSGPWVYGLEADLSGMHLKSEMNTSVPGLVGVIPTVANANTNADVDWYGTARARLGWAAGPLLFYGTGGLAYGRVELNSSISSIVTLASRFLSAQTSGVKTGWVAGGGIEYEWLPNLILNVGYQYVDLGTVSVAGTTTVPNGILSQSASAHAQFSVVSAGLSWRFAPGSKPGWEGLYVGGHAGGAWGNKTSANFFDQPPIIISDARLKRNITLVARLDDGLGLYRYRYMWSDTVYVGVMAQEVALIHPSAVVRSGLDSYLRVDYGQLGLKLMTLQEWEAHSQGQRL